MHSIAVRFVVTVKCEGGVTTEAYNSCRDGQRQTNAGLHQIVIRLVLDQSVLLCVEVNKSECHAETNAVCGPATNRKFT